MDIVFDPVLRRPGCVILQAAMGGNVPDFTSRFPAETWLTSPTPDMGCFPVNEPQLYRLIEMATEAVCDGEI